MDVTNPTIADDASETLVVGFEGDDTRIQLQNGKTVWTQGDQVSVFYKSDANQKWLYNGETGSRTAELKRVDAGVASARMDRVVVAYPYSDNYLLNLTTGDIEATMPAVQTYMKDSYGLDGNIMVASSYFTQFNLKNVCGWLKLQLTGDGEVVKRIKLRGNNGEQVAGLIYVDTENATSILASEMGNVTEDEGENITGGAGGNLVFDDTILTEVTLNCGEGVTLSSEATAFYIALPPQTFEKGFTVKIEFGGLLPMTLSTEKALIIERNHIQPMASVKVEPTSGYENGHEWIDLGLSVKWASCNVGATTPEEYGDYFAWGETSPKSEYYDYNCVTYGKAMEDFSGNPEYDAATANWNGSWRIPTFAEQKELIKNCTWNWTSLNGVNGMHVIGPNGNSIFLPAAGCCYGLSSYRVCSEAYYWDSTPYEDKGCYHYFHNSGYVSGWYYRFYGLSVRPVL